VLIFKLINPFRQNNPKLQQPALTLPEAMCITRRPHNTSATFQQEREFSTVLFISSRHLDLPRKKETVEGRRKRRKE